MERARDVLPNAEGEGGLVVAGRRRIFAGEDDEAGHVGVHILDIMSEDHAAIQLGRARRADSGAVVVDSFGHVFDRARGGERRYLLHAGQAAIEKTPALAERLRVRGDDANILQVNPGSRDQEMAHGQRQLAGNAQRGLVDQQIERRADRPFDGVFDREDRLIGKSGFDRGDECWK